VKDDKLYLINMLECIERIESYTSSGYEAFKSSTLIQDAVIRNFEILGEAAKRLSQELRRSGPEIPWTNIAGLRDVLIHNYTAVDIDKVWNIVENDLPALKAGLRTILNSV
jgi:uncharacterized protein with HEPN domain